MASSNANNVTIDMVAKEALRIAHEKATFIGTINRSYDDSFGKTGAKIGSTLRVRNPNQYTRRTGSRVMDVQDQAESTQTITVATQDGVDMRFNSAELTLDIDELSRRYIEPAVSVLVSAIDGDALATATKETFNTVGTWGTPVGTVASGFSDTSALGQARAKINQGLAPKDSNRSLQAGSFTMASIANGVKGLFLPQDQIKTAFLDGFVAHTAMADLYENERVWSLSTSDDLTGAIDESAATNFTQGTTTLHMDALGTTALVKGSVFTIAGIYQCHPETKASTGQLQQFVVAADVTPGSNECDVTFSPAIYTTGAKQNVCSVAGAELTWAYTTWNDVVVTFFGTASQTKAQNLMYHKDAFTFVTADLPIMDDAHKCVRMERDGLSLRVWQASDIRNDELLMRIDILYGFKTLRPYWACRITD